VGIVSIMDHGVGSIYHVASRLLHDYRRWSGGRATLYCFDPTWRT